MTGIIFLDVDGVLNSGRWFDAGKPGALADDLPIGPSTRAPLKIPIDSVAVGLLSPLVDAGARFVLSSAWRHGFTGPEMTALLRRFGFTGDVFDRTKFDSRIGRPETRGAQVYDWLVRHRYCDPYVILDDDDGEGWWAPVRDSLIHVEYQYGLQAEHVARALEMLRGDW